MVWLANGPIGMVALKQFPKIDGKYDSSVENELQISKCILPDFIQNDQNRLQSHRQRNKGIEMITKLLTAIETQEDMWLVYE